MGAIECGPTVLYSSRESTAESEEELETLQRPNKGVFKSLNEVMEDATAEQLGKREMHNLSPSGYSPMRIYLAETDAWTTKVSSWTKSVTTNYSRMK